jgi:ABC exporter DevA family ATP-binding subunit
VIEGQDERGEGMDLLVRPIAPERSEHDGAAVIAKGVSYVYGTDAQRRPVLAGVDFTLRRGEFVVLTGPSGAGKTTLLTLIGALRTLQSGSIDVLGTELVGLSAAGQRAVRRKIGFIFQEHNLFEALTAYQTLRLASELNPDRPSAGELLARSESLLGSLGMANYLHARPRQLSTGQKQRVAVARALINNPPLILADEPTASLDQEASRLVIALIRQRLDREGASALIVTHDARIFGYADRVVKMMDGRILESV